MWVFYQKYQNKLVNICDKVEYIWWEKVKYILPLVYWTQLSVFLNTFVISYMAFEIISIKYKINILYQIAENVFGQLVMFYFSPKF